MTADKYVHQQQIKRAQRRHAQAQGGIFLYDVCLPLKATDSGTALPWSYRSGRHNSERKVPAGRVAEHHCFYGCKHAVGAVNETKKGHERGRRP